MDPVSVVGLVGSCVTIIARAGAVATDIHDLTVRFRNVAKNVNLITVQLSTFKAAIVLLSSCLERRVTELVQQDDLIIELRSSLDACSAIISCVQEQVTKVAARSGSTGSFSFMTKAKHLWNESSVSDCVRMLEVQVQALSFLIQVLQLKSVSDQRSLLHSPQSRSVLGRARDDASSVNPGFEAATITSQRTADGESIVGPFAFDEDVLNSNAYRSAFFSLMRRELSNQPEPAAAAPEPSQSRPQDPFADDHVAPSIASTPVDHIAPDTAPVRKPVPRRIAQTIPTTPPVTVTGEEVRSTGSLSASQQAVSIRNDDDDDQAVSLMSTNTSLSQPAKERMKLPTRSFSTDGPVNLYDAAAQGDLEVIAWLLSEGANVEAGRNGWPPIRAAAHRGYLPQVSM